nr:MAG TPA: hypothetical protein [Caudoviricetes sp.]
MMFPLTYCVARQRAGFPFRSMCIPLRSLNHDP